MRFGNVHPDPQPRPDAPRGARGLVAILTVVVVLVLLFPTSCYVGDCFGYPGCEEFNGCQSLVGIRLSGQVLYVLAPFAALFAGTAVVFLSRPTLPRRRPDTDR